MQRAGNSSSRIFATTGEVWKRCQHAPFPQPPGKRRSIVNYLEHGVRCTGHLDEAKWALDQGIHPDESVRRNKQCPALMTAVIHQRVDAVKLMLEYGASPNARSGHYTALQLASSGWEGPNDDIIVLLLDSGADPLMDISPGDVLLSDLLRDRPERQRGYNRLVEAEDVWAREHRWTEEEILSLHRPYVERKRV